MTLVEKPIENMDGFYARSDGTIRTPLGIEKGFVARNGYATIDCGFCYRHVHRLIARTLVPNPCPFVFNTVDHTSRVKSDNSAANLRWCSQAMNCLNRESKNCKSGSSWATIKVTRKDTRPHRRRN